MQMNSYGWVILIIVCVAVVGWVGGEANYTVNGMPTDGGTLDFIGNLAIGQIDGMPVLFTVFLDLIPFFCGWIIYRQIRGQD